MVVKELTGTSFYGSRLYEVTFSCPFCEKKMGFRTRHNNDVSIRYRIMRVNQFHRDECPGYATPKFTGFDGIPDWTEKDGLIAELTKVIEYGANKNLELVNEVEGLRHQITSLSAACMLKDNRIESLADELTASQNSTKDWADRYQNLRLRITNVKTEARRQRGLGVTAFWSWDIVDMLEELLK